MRELYTQITLLVECCKCNQAEFDLFEKEKARQKPHKSEDCRSCISVPENHSGKKPKR